MATISVLLIFLTITGVVLALLLSRTSRHVGGTSLPRSLTLFQFSNVIVPDERGTTEIDAVFVGNTGIFVIEAKDYNAWIFGTEGDERWTARYSDGSTHQFQNPLRQNFRHVMALVERLQLPRDRFHSVVMFSEDCELKSPMPTNVLVGNCENYVRNMDGIRLTDVEVSKACEVLKGLEAGSSKAELEKHIERLHARFSSTTTCPRCGGALVERRSTKPTSDGKPFLGCRAFPRCTYTRRMDGT